MRFLIKILLLDNLTNIKNKFIKNSVISHSCEVIKLDGTGYRMENRKFIFVNKSGALMLRKYGTFLFAIYISI